MHLQAGCVGKVWTTLEVQEKEARLWLGGWVEVTQKRRATANSGMEEKKEHKVLKI